MVTAAALTVEAMGEMGEVMETATVVAVMDMTAMTRWAVLEGDLKI